MIKLDKEKVIPSAVDEELDESPPPEDKNPKTIQDEPKDAPED